MKVSLKTESATNQKWDTIVKSFVKIFGAFVLLACLILGLSMIFDASGGNTGLLITIILCGLIVVISPLIYGLVYMASKSSSGEAAAATDIFIAFRSAGSFIRSCVYGFVLFIIHYIIYLITFGVFSIFYLYLSNVAYLVFIAADVAFFIVMIGLLYHERFPFLEPYKDSINDLNKRLSLSKENVIETNNIELGTAVAIIFLLEVGTFLKSEYFFFTVGLIIAPVIFVILLILIKKLEQNIADKTTVS